MGERKLPPPGMLSYGRLAKGLGLSYNRVVTLVKQEGMPRDSLASAKTWRQMRSLENKGGAKQKAAPGDSTPIVPEPPRRSLIADEVEVPDDGAPVDTVEGLRKRLVLQTKIAAEAQKEFARYIGSEDIQGTKQAGETNNAAQKTLMLLEAEYQRRLLESGRILTVESAAERFTTVLAELRSLIDTGEQEFCDLVNPAHPAQAVKGYRLFKERLFTKLQEMPHA